MDDLQTCHYETLASNAYARVDRCMHCGCVSIHTGPLTFRVSDEGLEALYAVFAEATAMMRYGTPRTRTGAVAPAERN